MVYDTTHAFAWGTILDMKERARLPPQAQEQLIRDEVADAVFKDHTVRTIDDLVLKLDGMNMAIFPMRRGSSSLQPVDASRKQTIFLDAWNDDNEKDGQATNVRSLSTNVDNSDGDCVENWT